MVRGRKDVDWRKYLEAEDFATLSQVIDPDGWYAMETFERLGIGILREIALGQLEGVRMWGRFQLDQVRKHYHALIAPGEPMETMMRFRVLANSFFDFGALRVVTVEDEHAVVAVAYQMSPAAEETASYQTLGFFDRLLEEAGASEVSARFTARSWAGDELTHIDLHWTVDARSRKK